MENRTKPRILVVDDIIDNIEILGSILRTEYEVIMAMNGQKALQLAGNKRLKTDTYTLMRQIHTRNGRRDLLLFLYQPDLGRFYELAALAMTRA